MPSPRPARSRAHRSARPPHASHGRGTARSRQGRRPAGSTVWRRLWHGCRGSRRRPPTGTAGRTRSWAAKRPGPADRRYGGSPKTRKAASRATGRRPGWRPGTEPGAGSRPRRPMAPPRGPQATARQTPASRPRTAGRQAHSRAPWRSAARYPGRVGRPAGGLVPHQERGRRRLDGRVRHRARCWSWSGPMLPRFAPPCDGRPGAV